MRSSNLDDLSDFNAGTVVNEEMLRKSNIFADRFEELKILGRGELKHGLMIEADGVSQLRAGKIEKVGGTVTLRERKARTGMRVETEAQSEQDEVKPLKAVGKEGDQVEEGCDHKENDVEKLSTSK